MKFIVWSVARVKESFWSRYPILMMILHAISAIKSFLFLKILLFYIRYFTYERFKKR